MTIWKKRVQPISNFIRSVESMKHLRVTINVAVTVAMMLPTGIFAECCCSSENAGCCAITSSAEVPKTSCCSCKQTSSEQEAVCEVLPLGGRVCPTCEDCRARQISTAISVRAKNVVAVQPLWSRQTPVDGDLQQPSAKYVEFTLPVLSHNKRQALLCVWIH